MNNSQIKNLQKIRASASSSLKKIDQTTRTTLVGGGIYRLTLNNTIDTLNARSLARKLAELFGYNLIDQVQIATAVFEIARDIVIYAGQGEIVVSWREDDGQHKGLEYFCNDDGRHTLALTTVLQTGGDNTCDKLNLLGLRKLMDEFQVAEDVEHGNCVTMIKWMH